MIPIIWSVASTRETRERLLVRLCAELPVSGSGSVGPGFVLVAVDGVDGSGKSTFADALAGELRRQGRDVVVIRADDFHNLREVRYRRGRDSPEGFWLDSYDYASLERDVLEPFGPDGDGRYRSIATDLSRDSRVIAEVQRARPGTVAVVDGLFLHRDELAQRWDYSVFLDVPFEVTVARMTARDGTPPDPNHPKMRRYVEGQRLYFRACSPWARATRIIDNSDVDRPAARLRSEMPAASDR